VGECLHILTWPAPRPAVGGEGARGMAERDGQQRMLRPIQAVKDCPNPRCEYFAIMDAAIYAIVADGHHGQDGSIQNWWCQACGGTPVTASARFCIG